MQDRLVDDCGNLPQSGRKVYGVGVYAEGRYTASTQVQGVTTATKVYQIWKNILQRGYDPKYKRRFKTYADVTVSEDFHNFQEFCTWAELQTGFMKEGYEIDKDILVKNNKVYGPDMCSFVPKAVNYLFTNCKRARGIYPVGVHFHKCSLKYMAQLSCGGEKKYLGCFAAELDAFLAYKVAKELQIKAVAEQWRGEIDEKVYSAMMNYIVEITD